MVFARRHAEVEWLGTLEEGRGNFTVGNWMLGEVPVTWASRISSSEDATSPEELVAASHASCYATALSLVLEERKTPPRRLHVNAARTLDTVDGSFGITTMTLRVHG